MFRNPSIYADKKVYRLQWGYRRNLLILLLFILVTMPCATYGYSINAKGDSPANLLVYLTSLLIIVWTTWWILQLFRFRLIVRQDNLIVYAPGKSIETKWRDATRLEYVFELEGNRRFSLRLYLNNPKVTHKFQLPGLVSIFPFQIPDQYILLDIVYKLGRFGVLNESPTTEELSIHLRYFLRTPLGQNLIRYAPHVYGVLLGKYLPDYDLDLQNMI